MTKAVFTATHTIGFCTGACEPVQGGYGACASTKSRSWRRAVQRARRLAEQRLAENLKTVSDAVQTYAVCVVDDTSVEEQCGKLWEVKRDQLVRPTLGHYRFDDPRRKAELREEERKRAALRAAWEANNAA